VLFIAYIIDYALLMLGRGNFSEEIKLTGLVDNCTFEAFAENNANYL
jgi:hypothetical protein